MKLGLIADIHADVRALERTLALLDTLGAEQILCAGDLVDYGFWPDEAISLVRARGIPCVLGNHDRKLFTRTRERRKPRHSNPDAISPENRAYLRALPPSLEARYDGLRVAVYHGSLTDDTALVHPKFYRPQELTEMLETARADVLVLGHTHVPVYMETPAGVLINPGSALVQHNSDRPTSRTFGLLDTTSLEYRLFDVETGAPHALANWPWWRDGGQPQ